MSYIIIEVYSFACDNPAGCPMTYDCTPAASACRVLLDEAHRQLRTDGWTVKGRGFERRHLCPEHAAASSAKA